MSLPVVNIIVESSGKFDDAEGPDLNVTAVPETPTPEPSAIDLAPDFNPREGRTYIDEDPDLAWSESEGSAYSASDYSEEEDYARDDVDAEDWEVAEGGSSFLGGGIDFSRLNAWQR